MTQQESEPKPTGVRPVEVIMFLILGIIPIGLLYMFASQGIKDTQGQRFEHERRLGMVECMKELERQECRGQVDRMVLECYSAHKVETGAGIKDAPAFLKCISRSKNGKFRQRTKAEIQADEDAMKKMRDAR